jgi:hypothetical protein
MTKTLRILALLLVALPALAQAPRNYSQAELDQMLAPIALYPDALLSQVLMAATYPIEVVAAARWTRANLGLKGETAVRAVQDEDWDPSVKSLVAFPQILQRMDDQLEWTRSLGDAFLAQEPQLMDQVQHLRRRAQAAGSLRSDEQVQVEQQGQTIVVQPASPQVVYVPYYDPLVVYGSWWWPAYQPVVWAPWPGYARPYHPGVSVGLWWGSPVGLSVGFFFGNFDWHHRHVRVVHPTAYYYRPPVVVVNRTVVVDRGRWQHDPHHRRYVDYRAPEVRQRFAGAQVERRDLQREERRDARSLDRRDERPAARAQAQPPARVQAHPPALAPVQARVQTQPRAQPAAQTRVEQRQVRRVEPRIEPREAISTALPQAPAAAPPPARIAPAVAPQPAARPLPVAERREQRQAFREPARIQRREVHQERRAPAAPVLAAPGVQAAPRVQAQPQVRMPAAVAPPQPRAQSREAPRGEQRNEHRAGGGPRS